LQKGFTNRDVGLKEFDAERDGLRRGAAHALATIRPNTIQARIGKAQFRNGTTSHRPSFARAIL
jgi:hypothetical protein